MGDEGFEPSFYVSISFNLYLKPFIYRLKQHVFPMIGALPISEITIPDVVRVIERIADKGTIETAKRMKQLIAQIFCYATQRGPCEHNPAADLKDILPSREEKHHACLPIPEIPQLLRDIEARKANLSKYALQLIMLTFVRTSKLIGAR